MAYSLVPGEISFPVKTSFGYHLIRLLDKQGEKIFTQHIRNTIFTKQYLHITIYKKYLRNNDVSNVFNQY